VVMDTVIVTDMATVQDLEQAVLADFPVLLVPVALLVFPVYPVRPELVVLLAFLVYPVPLELEVLVA